MRFTSLRAWLTNRAPAARPRAACLRRRQCVPRLEALEGRLAPAAFTVDSLTDSNDPLSGSLRAAISASNQAPGPNQIDIAVPGTYRLTLSGKDDTNSAGDLDILRSVTIRNQSGGAVVIDAGGLTTADRVFDVAPTGHALNVQLTGLTVQGGNATGGGGIRVQNNTFLTLDNDVIRNNAAGAIPGGGIEALNSTLFLKGTVVENNRARSGGGGIYSGGGGLIMT